MQTKITSIGKRIPFKLSISIRFGFWRRSYLVGHRQFAHTTEPIQSAELTASVFACTYLSVQLNYRKYLKKI